MRTSALSRSVIAVATLGIGSVALAATPATAASTVTREQVIAAVDAVRADAEQDDPSILIDAVVPLANAACDVLAGETVVYAVGDATEAGDDADGLLAFAVLQSGPDEEDGSNIRFCQFGAVASTDATFNLTGAATLTYKQSATPGGDLTSVTRSQALSGGAGLTPAIIVTYTSGAFPEDVVFTANGNAVRTTTVTTTRTVTVAKTAAQKKLAKKTYAKRLKAAKKAYTKALDKAGSKKAKKTAAKKKYSVAKSSARTAYRKAVGAVRKNVQVSEPRTESRPFAVSVDQSSSD
jgi:hypothetical protein